MNTYLYLLIAFVCIGLLAALLVRLPKDGLATTTHNTVSPSPVQEALNDIVEAHALSPAQIDALYANNGQHQPGVTVFVTEERIASYMATHRRDVFRSTPEVDPEQGRGYLVTHYAPVNDLY